MSFFSRLSQSLRNLLRTDRNKKQDQWAARFDQPPANPKNPLPHEPGIDPWRS